MRLYLRSNINYFVELSTASSYARMLSTHYLVCRLGQAYLFPVFSTRHYVTYVGPPPSWLKTTSHKRFYTKNDFQKSYCKYVGRHYGRW